MGLFLAGCGDSPGASSLKFIKAVRDGNIERASSYLAEGVAIPADTSAIVNGFIVEQEVVSGQVATVVLRRQYDKTVPSVLIELEKSGASWRLKTLPF